MNYKSILNAVAVVVAVTMVMLVGCGGDSNPSGGGGNLTGNGVAWLRTGGDCIDGLCGGYIFNSDGTLDIIVYSRNANSCTTLRSGIRWSANGNKVIFDNGHGNSEIGTISGNTLTLNGIKCTRTTGIPCAN